VSAGIKSCPKCGMAFTSDLNRCPSCGTTVYDPKDSEKIEEFKDWRDKK